MRRTLGAFGLLSAIACGGTYYNAALEPLNGPTLDSSGNGFTDGNTHYAGCEDYCQREPGLRSLDSCAGPAHVDANGNPIDGAEAGEADTDAGVSQEWYVLCRGTWDRSGCDAPFSD